MSADDAIAQCLAGRISPEVALARLVLAGVSPEEIARRLVGSPADSSGAALGRLLAERRDGIDRLLRMIAASGLDHGVAATAPEEALKQMRAAFDRAVAHSPEASVAAYSLGEPATLDSATTELVDWLGAEGLIGPECDVLDLGCGIGRVAAALATRCRSVLGIDISPGMIAEAQRRHVLPNLRFAVTDGRDLSGVAELMLEQGDEKAVDLVLAVDSFPYLMQAGPALAERHVADAARLLRPGGALAMLNLSYRDDPAADREDVGRWVRMFGLRLACNGERPFALWDGAAFVLRT